MGDGDLVYAVAKTLTNEAEVLGPVGMWYIALVMVSRLELGVPWWRDWDHVLREFAGRNGPREPSPAAWTIAMHTVACSEPPNRRALRLHARTTPIRWRGGWTRTRLPREPLYYAFSREDVARHPAWPAADVVVTRTAKGLVLARGLNGSQDAQVAFPDRFRGAFQLHLYRDAPWTTQFHPTCREEEAPSCEPK